MAFSPARHGYASSCLPQAVIHETGRKAGCDHGIEPDELTGVVGQDKADHVQGFGPSAGDDRTDDFAATEGTHGAKGPDAVSAASPRTSPVPTGP